MKEFKLTMELVPVTAQYANLRNELSRSAWEKIAKETKEGQTNKCGICGIQGKRMYCHEIWDYDDSDFIYTLKGFISLCGFCHDVKHMGLTKIRAEQGMVDLDAVIEHFCQVNGCTRADYEEHSLIAFTEYHARSEFNWRPNFGEYSFLIQQERAKRKQKGKEDKKSNIRIQ